MSAIRPGSSAGPRRLLAKLKLALDNKNHYEAHQLYRTLYFRMLGQRKYSELEDLLYEGSLTLFEAGESTSGIDLTNLYLEVLKTAELKGDERLFERVARLYSLVPMSSPDKDVIMSKAIRWSTPEGSQHGHPRMHQMFAYNLWKDQRFAESRHHFLYSCDGAGCGQMMLEFHQSKGYSSEVDLFITATVLQLICLKKHITAANALKSYTEGHPEIKKGPPYHRPLLNFVWLLLLAIEHNKSLTAFSVLVEKYKRALKRDPQLLDYCDKIGQKFFGLPPPKPRPRPGGMFSGLIDSMMGAFNDSDSDSDNEQQPVRTTVRMETSDLD